MKKFIWILLGCVTVIFCCIFITNNLSSSRHTISVQWDWEVHVAPDTLILSLRVEETAATTEEAQRSADDKISQIKGIIKQYNIEASDIKSTNVNVYEDYDWTESWRVSRWFVASHSLEVKIKKVNVENDWVAWKIISEISKIGWVLVNNISYDIEDKTQYYSQARELAMWKAYQKASDLAEYAWVKLWKPVSISESRSYDYAYSQTAMMKNAYIEEEAYDSDNVNWSDISLWEMNITLTVSVVYGIR